MIKLCIWMNIPSHHQKAFFDSLFSNNEIDLKVVYYEEFIVERKQGGWVNTGIDEKYEIIINNDLDRALRLIPDIDDRVHIVPGNNTPFLKKLLVLLINRKLNWIHWSERAGVGYAKLLHFNYQFMRLFYPVFLYVRGYCSYAKLVNKYSLGAFANGKLAIEDFEKWGIKKDKIALLTYSLKKLEVPTKIDVPLKKANERIFMYVGTLYELKGIEVLLKSFAELKDKASQWKLVLVGEDKSNGYYKELTNNLNIATKVVFVGVVPSNKINEYLYQSDVFVFPTLFDGWGAVLNEAASLKKPIISTTQAGSAHHLLENKKNGYLVKPKSINELKGAMEKYIDSPELIKEHGEYSYLLFDKYSPEENTDKLLKTIKKWIKK